MNVLSQKIYYPGKYNATLFLLGFAYALYWLLISPIQYNGDSEGYLSIAYMLLGKSPAGIAPIFRAPGYPILLLLSGAVIPGTFIPLLLIQALFAGFIPILIYRILLPYGHGLAIVAALVAIFSGTTTIHSSQVMTETLFTFLLFLSLYIAIKLSREINVSTRWFCWLAVSFAALNSVRTIAWPMFWLSLLIIVMNLWYEKRLMRLWKSALGAALLFLTLMSIWVIANDVFFSRGAQYSPLTKLRENSDNLLEIYLYDQPFNEAYFYPWEKGVKNLIKPSPSPAALENQPSMIKIREILLEEIKKNKNRFLLSSVYPYYLFVKYTNKPQQLAEKMFATPNYIYANYIHSVLDQALSDKERFALYYAAAKETGRNWPNRWIKIWREKPFSSFMGPTYGDSVQRFLMVYTSLRHYIPDPAINHYHSLISEKNGPATRFMFDTITEALRSNPDLWRKNTLFGSYINNPDALKNFIITSPNQKSAWDITVILWDLMGYSAMSHLLHQVANETIAAHKSSLILRIWDTTLNIAAGPGYVEYDNLGPQFGKIEIYDYLETQQLTEQQKKELQSTRYDYESNYDKWQAPLQWGYFLFYLCKPLFLCTSLMAITILWSRKRPITVPLLLMLPYLVSVVIYGALFTALPRYTDPTILLPFIVTLIALPECQRIWRERRMTDLKK